MAVRAKAYQSQHLHLNIVESLSTKFADRSSLFAVSARRKDVMNRASSLAKHHTKQHTLLFRAWTGR